MESVKFKAGNSVRFISERHHRDWPENYPAVGTKGKIIFKKGKAMMIQWPKGSTSSDDRWYATAKEIEIIK